MFYDEKKSPYQYDYSCIPLHRNNSKSFELHDELRYIASHKIFSNNSHVTENYIRLYNNKTDIEHFVFSLFGEGNVINISIGGSYLFKRTNKFSDIDLNVIIKGDFFSYVDIPTNMIKTFIKNEMPYTKISIMVFGENLLQQKTDLDFIITPNYLHRDLLMRESLVRSYRNINLYGKIFKTGESHKCFQHNLYIRIKRQLKFANLIFDGLFDHYNTEERVASKIASRIGEAGMMLYAHGHDVDLSKYYDMYVGNYPMDIGDLHHQISILEQILTIQHGVG